MIRFLWAAWIYRDSNKSCTARINSGPAAPEASACGTIIFTIIQIGFEGTIVQKDKQKTRTSPPGKTTIDPSPPWPLWRVPLEGTLVVQTGWLQINQFVIIVWGSGNHAAPGGRAQVWTSVEHHVALMCPDWPPPPPPSCQHQRLLKHLNLGYEVDHLPISIPC